MTGGRAVVTGASGGIGSEIVRRLASDGFSVTLGYRSNQEAALQLASELPGTAHDVVQLSVTDRDSVRGLAEHLGRSGDRVDVLVNCAGMSRAVEHDDLDALDDDLIDEIFAVNWRGAFAVVRQLRPLLERSGDAVVVNISSIAGTTGLGSNVAYCASKAALDSMTRSLGRALAPAIRFVSVAPGWVEGEYASRMDPAMLDHQRANTPMGRLAEARDVADAVAAAVQLKMTTGVVLPVDGGRPLGTG